MRLKPLILSFVICGNTFVYCLDTDATQYNSGGTSLLTQVSFPTTAADVPFVKRVENKEEGYRPYFNRSAFADLSIEDQDALENMAYKAEMERLQALNTLSTEEYCKQYPADKKCPGADKLNAEMQSRPYPQSIYPETPAQTQKASDKYMSMALTPENVAKYNLKTYNGGCTPPEYHKHWRNNIQTSGQYENTDAPFEKIMITMFRKEGDCGSHQNDKGGYTCYGCASNGLCHGVDMKSVTRAKVENLANQKIYKAYNVHKLPDAFRGYAFWGMWGSGSIPGIEMFQRVLGTPVTKRIDDATIKAAENYTGDFGEAYTNYREEVYRNIVRRDASQGVFLNGWLNGLPLLRSSGCHVVPKNPIHR